MYAVQHPHTTENGNAEETQRQGDGCAVRPGRQSRVSGLRVPRGGPWKEKVCSRGDEELESKGTWLAGSQQFGERGCLQHLHSLKLCPQIVLT